MSTLASGTFEILAWQDQPVAADADAAAAGGPALVHATVTEAFHGDIEGSATAEYVLARARDGASAHFANFTRMTVRLAGRSGTFVMQRIGHFEGSSAMATWSVVPGSATGELAGLRGEGSFVGHHGEQPLSWAGHLWNPTPMRIATYRLEYDLP